MAVDVLTGRALPRVREPELIVGLDLGQRRDWTALGVVERREAVAIDPDTKEPRRVASYAVRELDRTRERSYEEIVAQTARLLRRPELAGCRFAIDETGVGQAVANMFDGRGLDPERITITGGTEATSDGRSHRVPKRDLATAVAVLLESRRLEIAEALPLAGVLKAELANFRVKVSLSGHDSYGAGDDWRENSHDDLVLAVAMAVWLGEQPRRDMWKGDYGW